jgi:hypothetical protein
MIVLYIAISSNTIQVYRGDQRGCSNPSVIDSEFQEKITHVATRLQLLCTGEECRQQAQF